MLLYTGIYIYIARTWWLYIAKYSSLSLSLSHCLLYKSLTTPCLYYLYSSTASSLIYLQDAAIYQIIIDTAALHENVSSKRLDIHHHHHLYYKFIHIRETSLSKIVIWWCWTASLSSALLPASKSVKGLFGWCRLTVYIELDDMCVCVCVALLIFILYSNVNHYIYK